AMEFIVAAGVLKFKLLLLFCCCFNPHTSGYVVPAAYDIHPGRVK
ncbi:hypothetical protein Tco_1287903, partial [Tanacetum coccineum]